MSPPSQSGSGKSVTGAADVELVQMRVGPAHRRLRHLMQLGQSHLPGTWTLQLTGGRTSRNTILISKTFVFAVTPRTVTPRCCHHAPTPTTDQPTSETTS
jgi:hypothetical protein